MKRVPWMACAAAVLVVAGGTRSTRGGEDAAETERLGFMAGCWQGRAEGGTIEERWTPQANVMLGTTRYLSGGRVTGFELAVIEHDGGEVVMTPYPQGNRSEHGFRLEPDTGDRAVFTAPEHDFPKRIQYGLAGGSLVIRIDGGAGSDEAAEWKLDRVDCEEEP